MNGITLSDEEYARQLAFEWGREADDGVDNGVNDGVDDRKHHSEYCDWTRPTHQGIPDVDTLSETLRKELPPFDKWTQLIDSVADTSFPPMLPFEKDALLHQHMSRISIYPMKSFPKTIEDLHFRIAESQTLRLIRDRYQVVKVDRVVNPILWNRYVNFCQRHDIQEELLLFHGTQNTTIQSILKDGFKIGGIDVKIATGTVHGKGVYLSEDPSFAMRYVRAKKEIDAPVETFDEQGSKCLLFSKCAVTADAKKVVNPATGLIEQLVCPHKEQVLPYYLVYIKA